MNYLYIVTGIAVIVSVIANREKTRKAFEIARERVVKIAPAFVAMLVLVSVVLFLVPDEAISCYLGADSSFQALLLASLIGSIILMPGFIAFPLCGILLTKGVLYMVLSAFTTTLMTVGILTSPIEKEYFGARVTIIRNATCFAIAIVVALITGIAFGELF
ncbi:MAG: hypothetical protein J7L90_03055 [Dehalococcoidia bacterium]|nr:hypothetical protein [Dehalococcoidia bacterium]